MRSAVALALVLLACRDDARAPSWGDHPVPTLATAAPPTPAPPPPAPATPDERAAFIRTHYTKYEYRVPMRDGVRLLTQVFVPNDAGPAKRYPFLITRTPYTVAPYGPDRYPGGLGPIAAIEQAGYIFVRQDVRGKGLSEGEFVDMRPHRANKRGTEFDESSDAYDTVAWLLAHVADHNGKAGIWGISYPGFYAAAAAIDAHPALVAVSPQAPCLDWWQGDDMHRHGAFALQEAFTFFYAFGHARPAPDAIERDAWLSVPWGTPDPYAYFLRLPPLASLDEAAFGGAVPQIWKDFIAHPDYDEFWTARSHARYLTGVRPAVLTVGGFYDAENAYGAVHTFRAIAEGKPRGDNHVLLGPWRHHGWDRGPSQTLGDADFGTDTSTIFPPLFVSFFEHHLKGAPDPGLPVATVFEGGADRWRRFPAWPPPGAVARTLHFQPDGGLAWTAPPATTTALASFVSDPARPVPYTRDLDTGWMTAGYMAEDQRGFARRPDVLVFQTEPLPADVTLAGPITVRLQVSTTGTDADWIVKLIDVEPEILPGRTATDPGARGGQQTLVRGEPMRSRYRDDPARPVALVADQVTPITFTMTDVFHTFARGHRLMVQVQSSWFPLIDRNPQTFVANIFAATAADYAVATHRVHAGTAIDVQVLPAADE